MHAIELKNISYFVEQTQNNIEIIKNLSIKVEKGEFLTIFGPNGCGKSTLLNIIASIIQIKSGYLSVNIPPQKTGYVFQDYRSSLMPWSNAKENVCLPLKFQKIDKKHINEKFEYISSDLPIDINWRNYPYQLSGGQAQLVSILRNLIIEPELMLYDEPFSALDYQTNLHMMSWIKKISSENEITSIFVSHQIDEAIYLGDRLIMMSHRPSNILHNTYIELEKERNLSIIGNSDFQKIKEKTLDNFIKLLDEN